MRGASFRGRDMRGPSGGGTGENVVVRDPKSGCFTQQHSRELAFGVL